MIDNEKWKIVEKILADNDIPKEFSNDLEKIVPDFEKKHIELKESNHAAFNILLLGTVYKAGKESGDT